MNEMNNTSIKKLECVLSFKMGWRILVFYPEPEASWRILVFYPKPEASWRILVFYPKPEARDKIY